MHTGIRSRTRATEPRDENMKTRESVWDFCVFALLQESSILPFSLCIIECDINNNVNSRFIHVVLAVLICLIEEKL